MPEAPLFGRGRELETLRDLYRRSVDGGAHVAFVTGEAGIGKTRLVEAFLAETEEGDGAPLVLRSRASDQFGASDPYLPFLGLLRQALGRDADLPQTSIAGLAQQLAPYWLSVIPVAGNLLSAAYETVRQLRDRVAGTAAELRAPEREALFFQYTDLLRELAARLPVVAGLDDLHWADASSVGLLFHLTRTLETAPVLFVGAYRPTDLEVAGHPLREAKLELERYGLATEVPLAGLDEEAGRRLLRRERERDAEAAPSKARLEDDLLRIAGGNPLFLEELARWSARHPEAGEAELLEALARAGPDAPRRMLSVLEKRLDALPAEWRRLLETASAAGIDFTGAVVAAATGEDELSVEEALEEVSRIHGLVRRLGEAELPDGGITTRYEFHHPIAHASLRARLVGRKGVEVHRRTATAVEHLYGSDPSTAGALAHLYRRARDIEKVRHHARRAARRSEDIFALPEAARFVDMALEAGPPPAERLELLVAKGRVLTPLARFREALEALEAAVALARELGEDEPELEARRLLARCRFASGDRPPLAIAEEMGELIEEGRRRARKEELYHILDTAAMVAERAGLAERMRAMVREQLELAEERGDDALRASALFRAARAEVFFGDPLEADRLARRAIDAYTRLGHLPRRAESRNLLALVAHRTGRWDEAIENWKRALAEFDHLVQRERGLAMRSNIAEALTDQGRFAEAAAWLAEALDGAEELGRPQIALLLQTALVRLRSCEGRWRDALSELERLRQRVEGHWMYDLQSTTCGLLARLALGDEEGARLEGLRLRRLTEGCEERYFERRAEADIALSRLDAREGRAADARARLERGLEILSPADVYGRAILELELARHRVGDEAQALRSKAMQALRAAGVRRLPAALET